MPPGYAGSRLNAMTVDVEDYFHVSVFDRTVARADWESMESRVVGNTNRLLDLFDEHAVRGTFFVLGWVAERYPALVRSVAGRGHELASHGYAHRLVYEQTPEVFAEWCLAEGMADSLLYKGIQTAETIERKS